MNRRYHAVFAALLIVLAGCSGGAGPASDGATPTATASGGTTGGSGTGGSTGGSGTSGSGTSGGGGGSASVEWTPYEFRAGEYYEYEVHEAGESLGTFSWEVLAVENDGETVTVRVAGDVEGQQFETTTTGDPETIYSNFLTNPAGAYVFLSLYSPFVGAYRGETLAVGQGWTYTGPEGTVAYGIERTDSLLDREVFVSVIRENDVPQYEVWIDAELAFAAKTVIYDEGAEDVRVELIEYRN